MARKRYIDIYYNVVDGVLQDSTGVELAPSLTPYISYQEKPMVRLQLVTDSSNTAYTELSESSGDYTVSAIIDSDFDSASLPYCRTLNASINVDGEWKNDGNADIGQGEFSIPLDGNNTDFEDRIGTARSKTDTLFEIQLRDAGDNTILAVFRFPFFCLGLMDISGGVPAGAAATNYYTKTEVDDILDSSYYTASEVDAIMDSAVEINVQVFDDTDFDSGFDSGSELAIVFPFDPDTIRLDWSGTAFFSESLATPNTRGITIITPGSDSLTSVMQKTSVCPVVQEGYMENGNTSELIKINYSTGDYIKYTGEWTTSTKTLLITLSSIANYLGSADLSIITTAYKGVS